MSGTDGSPTANLTIARVRPREAMLACCSAWTCGTSAASVQPVRSQYRRPSSPRIASAWPWRTTKGWPQPQQVFERPFARYGVIFCMSQARMNDEGDDRGNQRDAECRRDVELGRSVVAETKCGLNLPHDFLLASTARLLNSARMFSMRFACRPIHQTDGQWAHTLVWSAPSARGAARESARRQRPGADARRSFAAMLTRSARESASILRITRPR